MFGKNSKNKKSTVNDVDTSLFERSIGGFESATPNYNTWPVTSKKGHAKKATYNGLEGFSLKAKEFTNLSKTERMKRLSQAGRKSQGYYDPEPEESSYDLEPEESYDDYEEFIDDNDFAKATPQYNTPAGQYMNVFGSAFHTLSGNTPFNKLDTAQQKDQDLVKFMESDKDFFLSANDDVVPTIANEEQSVKPKTESPLQRKGAIKRKNKNEISDRELKNIQAKSKKLAQKKFKESQKIKDLKESDVYDVYNAPPEEKTWDIEAILPEKRDLYNEEGSALNTLYAIQAGLLNVDSNEFEQVVNDVKIDMQNGIIPLGQKALDAVIQDAGATVNPDEVSIIDPAEVSTVSVVDPAEVSTVSSVDPAEVSTVSSVDPAEVSTVSVNREQELIDKLVAVQEGKADLGEIGVENLVKEIRESSKEDLLNIVSEEELESIINGAQEAVHNEESMTLPDIAMNEIDKQELQEIIQASQDSIEISDDKVADDLADIQSVANSSGVAEQKGGGLGQ